MSSGKQEHPKQVNITPATVAARAVKRTQSEDQTSTTVRDTVEQDISQNLVTTNIASDLPEENVNRPIRVLVAEDEVLIRLDLVEMLREEEYDVVTEAGDGQAAVDLATELHPDLVIMDVKMPRRDGIDAASEITEKRIAPVVILTAFGQRDLINQAREAGAMAYLVKPFTITDLIPAIELATSRFSELVALEKEIDQLADRLEVRKLIDRAKGLLMTKQQMTEPEAFQWIQRAAMDRRTTMKEVSQVIVDTLSLH